MTDSHFDVLMVLLGVRRLIVQRLEQKKEQSELFSAVQQIVDEQIAKCPQYDSDLAPV